MSDDPAPERRVHLRDLNWLGKSVFLGGAVMRLTAKALDATANRVQTIASRSKRAFERELDPNIEDARVLEEYPHPEESVDPSS